jgi:probable nitrogen fixation protein
MTSVVILEKPQQFFSFEELFLQELIEQFHLQDRRKVYQSWSDRLILDFFITSERPLSNFNIDYLNQLLISAFYHAIAQIIEQKTDHDTQTFVHVKNKEYSSAVVFCGGVLVVYSLIWGYKKYGFDSSEKMLKEAQKIIEAAMTKASLYLDIS